MSGSQLEMHFMRDEKGNWKEMAPKNTASAKLAINLILDGGAVTAEELALLLRAQADALSPPAEASKPKKQKAKKKDEEENDDADGTDSDSGDDESDSDEGDDDSSDADEGSDEKASEDGESEDGDDSSDDSESEDSDEDGDESEAGPSKKECIGLLKKLATKKNKKTAMAVMKKVTGNDSIHDVSAKHYAKLASALKKAAK